MEFWIAKSGGSALNFIALPGSVKLQCTLFTWKYAAVGFFRTAS